MKKIAKMIGKVLLVVTGISLAAKGSIALYWRAFGKPHPAPSFRKHWQDVKETFPDIARDMDSKEIIEERRKDLQT